MEEEQQWWAELCQRVSRECPDWAELEGGEFCRLGAVWLQFIGQLACPMRWKCVKGSAWKKLKDGKMEIIVRSLFQHHANCAHRTGRAADCMWLVQF